MRVKEQSDHITQYMEECMTKVGMYFRRTDEQMMKTQRELQESNDMTLTLKFDIDKLLATTTTHSEKIFRCENSVAKL